MQLFGDNFNILTNALDSNSGITRILSTQPIETVYGLEIEKIDPGDKGFKRLLTHGLIQTTKLEYFNSL